jgi:hypothetical protein
VRVNRGITFRYEIGDERAKFEVPDHPQSNSFLEENGVSFAIGNLSMYDCVLYFFWPMNELESFCASLHDRGFDVLDVAARDEDAAIVSDQWWRDHEEAERLEE